MGVGVHVPSPVVLTHVAKRRIDATLRGDRVGARGEELRDAGRLEPGLREANGGAKPSAARTDHDSIVLVVYDLV